MLSTIKIGRPFTGIGQDQLVGGGGGNIHISYILKEIYNIEDESVSVSVLPQLVDLVRS